MQALTTIRTDKSVVLSLLVIASARDQVTATNSWPNFPASEGNRILSLVILPCISAAPAPVSAAQDPIRVQSDEVLVPTVMFDEGLYAQLNKMKAHHRDS
jgi:hypothetical protein